jgi:hypothetical protein
MRAASVLLVVGGLEVIQIATTGHNTSNPGLHQVPLLLLVAGSATCHLQHHLLL